MYKMKFLSVFCVAGLAAVAFGDKPALQQAGDPTPQGPYAVNSFVKVNAKRIALIDQNKNFLTDWIDLTDAMIQEDCGASLCYDQLETNGGDIVESAPGDGYYGADCGMGATRWFLGTGYCNTWWANDMEMAGGCDGKEIGRLQHAWWWQVNGPGTSERCYIDFEFYEDFDDCNGGSGFLVAFVVDFGELTSSDGTGYYYTDLNLCNLFNTTLTGPADGAGMYLAAYFNRFNGFEDFTFATCAQPMLWSTDKPLNYSEQGPLNFDDVNPRDGFLTWNDECFSYDFGVCPGLLGPASAFWQKGQRDGDGNQITPKLRAKCLQGGSLIARFKNGRVGETVTFELDGGQRTDVVVTFRRKATALFRAGAGPHTVRVLQYELMRNQECE